MMTPEYYRYVGLADTVCYRGRDNCPEDRKKACAALQKLTKAIKKGKATGKQRDAVRETMRRLDRCRVQSGERLSLYGLKRRRR